MIITATPKTRTLALLQWTGDNLREVQDFLAPASPALSGRNTDARLALYIRDERSERDYPTLGPQDTLTHIQIDDWIAKDPDGAISVYTNAEARAIFDGLPAEVVAPPAANPVPPPQQLGTAPQAAPTNVPETDPHVDAPVTPPTPVQG